MDKKGDKTMTINQINDHRRRIPKAQLLKIILRLYYLEGIIDPEIYFASFHNQGIILSGLTYSELRRDLDQVLEVC